MHVLPMIVLLAVAEAPPRRLFEQTVGEWSVWVESSLVESTRQHRAVSYRQVVTRRGPEGQSVLFEGDSTGQWVVAMNEQGVVLVYGVGLANLFFPGKKEAVTFEIQGHPAWISSNMSQVFMFGDTIFYADSMQGVLMGAIELDIEHQKVRGERVFYRSEPYSRSAVIALTPRPIRLGSFIFFKLSPSPGQADRQQRRSQILDLIQGKLVAPSGVPKVLLNSHRDEVLPFIDGDPQ